MSLQNKIIQARSLLKGGSALVFPTDTVFGLVFLPGDPAILKLVSDIKQRKEGKEYQYLACCVARAKQVFAQDLVNNTIVNKIMDNFWPGPLTIVGHFSGNQPINSCGCLVATELDIKPKIVCADTGLIGVRVPKHESCAQLVTSCQGFLQATSVNLSDHPSAVTNADVDKFLSSIDPALTDKVKPFYTTEPLSGLPSTVLKLEVAQDKIVATMLRQGAVKHMDILSILNPEERKKLHLIN